MATAIVVATFAAHTRQELDNRVIVYALALFLKNRPGMPGWEGLVARAKRAMNAVPGANGDVAVLRAGDVVRFGIMTERAEAGHR